MSGAFSYRATKAEQVLISWNGRTVTTLSGARAQRFLAEAEQADADAEQLLMGRATGNFKRGNER